MARDSLKEAVAREQRLAAVLEPLDHNA